MYIFIYCLKLLINCGIKLRWQSTDLLSFLLPDPRLYKCETTILRLAHKEKNMKLNNFNDICGGFTISIAAMKTTLLLFVILLLNVKADVQQPPLPPTVTRPTVDKFMKREHSLMKPFQGKSEFCMTIFILNNQIILH